jgi:type IV secretion system protein VirB1
MIPAALLACAPNIAPVTLEAVIRVESGGNPLAINVNGLPVQPAPVATAAAAARTAESYIQLGYSVDLGLMQVNSRNLVALGTTVERVLDPCTNVRDGTAILTADYAEAASSRGDGQPALRAALSAYNTGSFYRGFANGYVARFYGPAGVPALAGGLRDTAATAASAMRAAPSSSPPPPPNPYTADTSVFAREANNVRIE